MCRPGACVGLAGWCSRVWVAGWCRRVWVSHGRTGQLLRVCTRAGCLKAGVHLQWLALGSYCQSDTGMGMHEVERLGLAACKRLGVFCTASTCQAMIMAWPSAWQCRAAPATAHRQAHSHKGSIMKRVVAPAPTPPHSITLAPLLHFRRAWRALLPGARIIMLPRPLDACQASGAVCGAKGIIHPPQGLPALMLHGVGTAGAAVVLQV